MSVPVSVIFLFCSWYCIVLIYIFMFNLLIRQLHIEDTVSANYLILIHHIIFHLTSSYHSLNMHSFYFTFFCISSVQQMIQYHVSKYYNRRRVTVADVSIHDWVVSMQKKHLSVNIDFGIWHILYFGCQITEIWTSHAVCKPVIFSVYINI